MLRDFTKILAGFAIAAILIPTIAFAHNGGRGGDDDTRMSDDSVRAWTINEFGVRVLGANSNLNSNSDDSDNRNRGRDSRRSEDKSNKGLHLGQLKHGFMSNLFYNGTVTATSSTGFTIEAKDGTDFVVDADSAKITLLPRTPVVLADIKVGDKVFIKGTESDNQINATSVYLISATLQPATAKGTVTAVNNDDNTITVQTTEDTTITVNMDDSTTVKDSDGKKVEQTEIDAGATVKLKGFWDSVKNAFNAIKIKLS